MTAPRWLLAAECFSLFVLVPTLLAQYPFHRPTLYSALGMTCAYVFVVLSRDSTFSWRSLWLGDGWPPGQRQRAAMRFLVATVLSLLLLAVLAPHNLFDFPLQLPGMWAVVMVMYPVISVLPQEFVYRSFFFRRYAALFPARWTMVAANAAAFSYMHIVLQNIVAPLLCLIAGIIIAYGYTQHRSLKYAFLEHAAYGCMIFTVGLGWYFFRGLQG